jgi:hypothetical protein
MMNSPVEGKSKSNHFAESLMLMDINRKLETSLIISENGTKTVKKAHLEVVTGYNSKDGTEATKDENPAFKIDRHLVEQTATLSDKTEETLMERKETFTFLASGDYNQKSPFLYQKKPKVDLGTTIEEPTEGYGQLGCCTPKVSVSWRRFSKWNKLQLKSKMTREALKFFCPVNKANMYKCIVLLH